MNKIMCERSQSTCRLMVVHLVKGHDFLKRKQGLTNAIC